MSSTGRARDVGKWFHFSRNMTTLPVRSHWVYKHPTSDSIFPPDLYVPM
jgi:hypothetical protein